jgi:transcriptional regulator GlxA family with amidase domain
VSTEHLCRQFKAWCGTSIGRYIRLLRLNRAAGLLWGTAIPISEIAFLCGFCDQSQLTREMDALFSLSPHSFRQMAPCIGNARLAAVGRISIVQEAQ